MIHIIIMNLIIEKIGIKENVIEFNAKCTKALLV
jgi:hypothetical protein